jgi:hypothetical protein
VFDESEPKDIPASSLLTSESICDKKLLSFDGSSFAASVSFSERIKGSSFGASVSFSERIKGWLVATTRLARDAT